MPRADLPKSGRWRAVYLETRQHGSGRGGWNRARSRLAVIAQANGRVNELRRKPSTSPAAYSTKSRLRSRVGLSVWWVATLRAALVLWRDLEAGCEPCAAMPVRRIRATVTAGCNSEGHRGGAGTMLGFCRFSLSNMVDCGGALRSMGDRAGSMEEVAGRIVAQFDDWFRDPETGESACVLVRLFKTHMYQHLPTELQTIAREQMAPASPAPETRCLTLLGTTGRLPEWRTQSRSKGHRVIPLPSVEVMARFPMITQLVRQLGLEVGSMLYHSPRLLVDWEQRTF